MFGALQMRLEWLVLRWVPGNGTIQENKRTAVSATGAAAAARSHEDHADNNSTRRTLPMLTVTRSRECHLRQRDVSWIITHLLSGLLHPLIREASSRFPSSTSPSDSIGALEPLTAHYILSKNDGGRRRDSTGSKTDTFH